MISAVPAASDILCASATATTATMITIPSGRWYTASISLSATVALAGTANLLVTFTPTGTGCGPSVTTVIARCVATGLLAASGCNDTTVDVVLYGGDSGATIGFTAGAAGSSTCVINGFLE